MSYRQKQRLAIDATGISCIIVCVCVCLAVSKNLPGTALQRGLMQLQARWLPHSATTNTLNLLRCYKQPKCNACIRHHLKRRQTMKGLCHSAVLLFYYALQYHILFFILRMYFYAICAWRQLNCY